MFTITSTYDSSRDAIVAVITDSAQQAVVTIKSNEVIIDETDLDFIVKNFKVLNNAHFAAKVVNFLFEYQDEDADVPMTISEAREFAI